MSTSLSKERSSSFSKGFTLIELLVVFSVLTILAISGLVSYASYSRTQAVTNERNTLITTLNVAKARAQAQVKPASCAAQSLTGYTVVVNATNETYTLRALCSSSTVDISTTTLPTPDIVIVSTSTPNYTFPVLTGTATSGTITIRGYGTINQTVNISPNGTIN